jgi:hypothetical protein
MSRLGGKFKRVVAEVIGDGNLAEEGKRDEGKSDQNKDNVDASKPSRNEPSHRSGQSSRQSGKKPPHTERRPDNKTA